MKTAKVDVPTTTTALPAELSQRMDYPSSVFLEKYIQTLHGEIAGLLKLKSDLESSGPFSSLRFLLLTFLASCSDGSYPESEFRAQSQGYADAADADAIAFDGGSSELLTGGDSTCILAAVAFVAVIAGALQLSHEIGNRRRVFTVSEDLVRFSVRGKCISNSGITVRVPFFGDKNTASRLLLPAVGREVDREHLLDAKLNLINAMLLAVISKLGEPDCESGVLTLAEGAYSLAKLMDELVSSRDDDKSALFEHLALKILVEFFQDPDVAKMYGRSLEKSGNVELKGLDIATLRALASGNTASGADALNILDDF